MATNDGVADRLGTIGALLANHRPVSLDATTATDIGSLLLRAKYIIVALEDRVERLEQHNATMRCRLEALVQPNTIERRADNGD